MAISEARLRANKKWNAANADRYERINIMVKAGSKEKVVAAAKAAGESISQYIYNATLARMEAERATRDE